MLSKFGQNNLPFQLCGESYPQLDNWFGYSDLRLGSEELQEFFYFLFKIQCSKQRNIEESKDSCRITTASWLMGWLSESTKNPVRFFFSCLRWKGWCSPNCDYEGEPQLIFLKILRICLSLLTTAAKILIFLLGNFIFLRLIWEGSEKSLSCPTISAMEIAASSGWGDN